MTTIDRKTPSEEELAAAELAGVRAFTEKYGRDLTDSVNNFCRAITLDVMRIHQAWVHDDFWHKARVDRYLKEKNMTLGDLKVKMYHMMFRWLKKLCLDHPFDPLTPPDIIKGCAIGPNPTRQEMEGFWGFLWDSLPAFWRSKNFQWHHMAFSSAEFSFFVWMRRPSPSPSRGLILRKTTASTPRGTKAEGGCY